MTPRPTTALVGLAWARRARRNGDDIIAASLIISLSLLVALPCRVAAVTDSHSSSSVCDEITDHNERGVVCGSMTISAVNSSEHCRCGVIEGYLKLEKMRHNLSQLRFPLLTEIREYLVIFDTNMTSFQQHFPKLRLIRGEKLLHLYSLAFFALLGETDIRIPIMPYLLRGFDYIPHFQSKCSNPTRNILGIAGPRQVDFTDVANNKEDMLLLRGSNQKLCHGDEKTCNQRRCPQRCKNRCTEDGGCCHLNCILGCAKKNSNEHCVACKDFRDGDKCVQKCQNNKFALGNSCVTSCDEINGIYLIKGTKECTTKCYRKESPRVCLPEKKDRCGNITIDSINDVEALKGCKVIYGNLYIKELAGGLEAELEKDIEVERIEGSLWIHRTNLENVKFLKDVKHIGANSISSVGCAIEISGNKRLRTLSDWLQHQPTVGRGMICLDDNPYLCPEEIKNSFRNVSIENFKFSNQNGILSICGNETLTVYAQSLPLSGAMRLSWMPQEEYIYYVINYKVVTETDTMEYKPRLKWRWSRFPFTPKKKIPSGENQTLTINNLKYAQVYAFFIEGFSTNSTLGLSKVITARSSSYYPSSPRNVTAVVSNDGDLNVSWQRPKNPNGVVQFYVLLLKPIHVSSLSFQDICHFPKVRNAIEKDLSPPLPTFRNSQRQEARGSGVEEESYSEIRYEFDKSPSNPVCRDTRSSMRVKDNSASKLFADNSASLFNEPTEPGILRKSRFSDFVIQNVSANIMTYVTTNTTYSIRNLSSGNYDVQVFSCQEESRSSNDSLCSLLPGITIAKLPKNESRDKITDISYATSENDLSYPAWIKWEAPSNPNARILGYEMQTFRQNFSSASKRCTTDTYLETIDLNIIGNWLLRLRTLTESGPGPWSQQIDVYVKNKDTLFTLYIGIIIMLVFIAIFIIILYLLKKNGSLYLIQRVIINGPAGSKIIRSHFEREGQMCSLDMTVTYGQILGSGEFSDVYKGIDEGIPVAFKRLKERRLREHFSKEAHLLSELSSCEYIIQFRKFSWKPECVIVMDLMEMDLRRYLKLGQTNGKDVKRILHHITSGLKFLAMKQIIHRDLKPANVLLDRNNNAKIADFGLAIRLNPLVSSEKMLGADSNWAAPECFDGTENLTLKADIFSFGRIMETIGKNFSGATNQIAFRYDEIRKSCLESQPERRYSAEVLQSLLISQERIRLVTTAGSFSKDSGISRHYENFQESSYSADYYDDIVPSSELTSLTSNVAPYLPMVHRMEGNSPPECFPGIESPICPAPYLPMGYRMEGNSPSHCFPSIESPICPPEAAALLVDEPSSVMHTHFEVTQNNNPIQSHIIHCQCKVQEHRCLNIFQSDKRSPARTKRKKIRQEDCSFNGNLLPLEPWTIISHLGGIDP